MKQKHGKIESREEENKGENETWALRRHKRTRRGTAPSHVPNGLILWDYDSIIKAAINSQTDIEKPYSRW